MVSTLVAVLTVGISVIIAGALVFGIRHAQEQAGPVATRAAGWSLPALVAGWLGLAVVLARRDVFATEPDDLVPFIGLGIAVPVVAGVAAWLRSARVRALVAAIPLPALIGVQLYRVVGALFLVALAEGALPEEFALHAGIGDVLIGICAPLVALAVARGWRHAQAAARTWGVLGLLDLVAAVAAGFLTSPSTIQVLALDDPNYAITRFPLVLIPLFAVPVSVLLHLAALVHPSAGSAEIRPGSPAALAGRHS